MEVSLKESVNIQDSNSVVIEKDAIIYLNEFLKYKEAYEKEGMDETLIFAFIFLQIYIECFLHQSMRRVMHMEFGFKEPVLFQQWDSSEEKMYIGKKIEFFTSFFMPEEQSIESKKIIVKSFNDIGQVRNKLVHGYKLSRGIANGKTHKSEALSLLNIESLQKSLQSANELGSAWNDLLDEIFKACRALRSVDDFKLKPFKVD